MIVRAMINFSNFKIFYSFIFLLTIFWMPAFAGETIDTNSAVILMYHRFGESQYPTTSIRLDQFEAHLKYLKDQHYTVLPLPEIIEKLQKGETLPEKTVGISIDDAYKTAYTQAWPRLEKAGFPFTVFVATDPLERGFKDMMSWDEIRYLAKQGVTIGNHTASHPYLETLIPVAAKADIVKAQKRLTEELGKAPQLFAYPFGEYDQRVLEIVKEQGFKAAFLQISGAIGQGSPMLLLPRFPLNEHYGTLDRFKMLLNTLPLNIEKLSPSDPVLKKNNPPRIKFTVSDKNLNLKKLACYGTDVDKFKIEIKDQTVQLISAHAFIKGRTHVNCTLPSEGGKWYWVSFLYIV
jgi:peptidoglycan/xylan/chitin deacetylase (PgdA/CDA1 family)